VPRIMLADDSVLSRKMLVEMLKTREYEVFAFESGQAILDNYNTIKPDLVLLDYNMPNLNGLETCIELRKRPGSYNVPIAVVSSVDTEAEIVSSLTNGADDYILKPVRRDELLSKVAILLARRNADLGSGMAANVVFAGHYKLERLLGKGGYSSVYLAKDIRCGQHVAVKIFEPDSMPDDSGAQFLREAYELSLLSHPNVVKFMKCGEYADRGFIVMEYIAGDSLNAIIKRKPCAERFALFVAEEVAKALAYLESKNVIHRDIKSDNILITTEQRVVLIDFGLSKKRNQDTLSSDGEFRGTPQYISPEYIRNERLSTKTDIYSLGITLYYAASGQFPFNYSDPSAIINAHLNEQAVPLNNICAEISEGYSLMVSRMLSKDPASRPSPNELIRLIATNPQTHPPL